ncbi:MAG: 3-oxoacyl-[acyl-carrier-protein] reductase FabG [Actinomycetota bacterium]|jgi:3-oxoacyl-[acyl-carrier protein] reductase
MSRLDGRRAIISGGANGLGAATARLFASEGAAVAVADLDSSRPHAMQLIDEIEATGGQAIFVPMDVREVEQVHGGVDATIEAFGGVDIVVASAGVGRHPEQSSGFNELLHIDPEHYDFVQSVNTRGVFLLAQRAAQHMVATNTHGSIVTIASMASKRPSAGAYSVSKAAVWMLTRCLAQELGKHHIRVNAIGPGYVETELFDGLARSSAGPDPEAQAAWREQRRSQVVLGEFPTADDIAQTALFLCSDAGRSFTGSILHPDGGYTSSFGGG